MGREAEFLFYRNKLDKISGWMAFIHDAVSNIMTLEIDLPEVILDKPFSFHCDSLTEEEMLNSELDAFIRKKRVPLFDPYTLMLLSHRGAVWVSGSTGVTERNVAYHLDEIKKLSAPFEHPPTPMLEMVQISFDGFRETEVNRFVLGLKRKAENSIRDLRDINTCTKYLSRTHLRLRPDICDIEREAPQELRQSSRSTELMTDKIPMFSEFWLTKAFGTDLGRTCFANFSLIQALSTPTKHEPDTLDFFSSNTDNIIRINYDEAS